MYYVLCTRSGDIILGMAEDFSENEGMERLFGGNKEEKPIDKGLLSLHVNQRVKRKPIGVNIESSSIAGSEKKASVAGRNTPLPVSNEEDSQGSKKNTREENLIKAAEIGLALVGAERGRRLVNEGIKYIKGKIHGKGSVEEIDKELKRRESIKPDTPEGQKIQAMNIERLQREKDALLKKQNEGGSNSEPPKGPPSGGKTPENKNGDENDPIKNAGFAKVMSMSNDTTLSVKDRAPWVKEKESRIEEFKKFDEGDFVADTRERFQTLMRTSGWDKEGGNGVYDKLVEFSENRDNDYKNRHGSELRLRGLLGIAIRSEAARVLVAGVENKLRGITRDDDVDSWLSGKHYTDDELNRLARLAKENHIFDFGTDAPEELVGSSTKRDTTFVPTLTSDRHRERQQSLREIPLYFGAVFAGGKNEVYVDRPDLIPTLDITSEIDRTKFIFKNIHAFDYRFGKASAWKGAIDDWMKDVAIADETIGIEPGVKREFLKRLKAMMAITASARAMEDSEGVAKKYLVTLLGGNEKGEPNLGEQDLSSSLLLHADPEKLNKVINDPLIKPFYNRIMEDAGLDTGPSSEWIDQTPSTVKLEAGLTAENIRERSGLVKYLKDEAKNGGIQKYIDDVLLVNVKDTALQDFDNDVRMTAAKIACDAFLVDKWTRWEDELQEHDKIQSDGKPVNLKLQPKEEWGGDPLKSILKPTFLPRLKGVYTDKEDEVILKLVDSALKPDDIFAKIKSDADKPEGDREYEDISKIRPLVPSMVTNLKFYSRLSDATYKVFGGSMASGLPNWNRDALEEIPQIADLLTQVYGSKTVKIRKTGEEFPIGKHIVGDMMMRILYAKSLAATVESSKPGFAEKMDIIFNPQDKTRPFMEARVFLYGPKLNNHSGFMKSMAGGRTRLVIADNMFDAEKYYDQTWNLLETDDQGGGSGAKSLNALGLAFDFLQSVGKNTGVIKR